MRMFSYVVARDFGFAPNPFNGWCTLATCKPEIRKSANVGDWILGTGSKSRDRADRVVYVMCVTETLAFNDYWADSRLRCKRPNLRGSKKQAFGDNIYHREPDSDSWAQENSHHTYADGTTNLRNVATDTKCDRVLLSNDFAYWGGYGPELPPQSTTGGDIDLRAHRGYKSKIFSDALILDVVRWIRDIGECGYLGEPLDWQRTP